MENERSTTEQGAAELDKIRRSAGVKPQHPRAPFRLIDAARDGTGDDGGVLDRGITARLPDGREVVVGELWAAGHADDGGRVSLDVLAFGLQIIGALNADALDGDVDMRCIGCGEEFDSEDDVQSRFHESACQEPDVHDVVAEISRRLRRGRRS